MSEVSQWPGVSHDMLVAGWELHESRSESGKPYFWNAKTNASCWCFDECEGWGWRFKDSKSDKKVYVHLVTGWTQDSPPGSQHQTKRSRDDSPPAKKRTKTGATADLGKTKSKDRSPPVAGGSKSYADNHKNNNNMKTAKPPLQSNPQPKPKQKPKPKPAAPSTAVDLDKTPDYEEYSDEEETIIKDDDKQTPADDPHNRVIRPAWKDVDISKVEITDPRLVEALDWRADPRRWRKQKNSPHVLQAFNNNAVVYRSLSDMPFTYVHACMHVCMRCVCACMCACDACMYVCSGWMLFVCSTVIEQQRDQEWVSVLYFGFLTFIFFQTNSCSRLSFRKVPSSQR